jgi:hypothetical protein
MKKITLSTVKSFVNKNRENLLISIESHFDGMTDCVQSCKSSFEPVKEQPTEWLKKDTLNIDGAWFVGSSRDYFYAYENDKFQGIEVSNSCGSFILAIAK